MDRINTVAIVGGTHGNEFSGIYLVKQWKEQIDKITRPSFTTSTLFANPMAYQANKRYLDSDLNRQFSLDDLSNVELADYEQSRAKAINAHLGPKGNAKTDFIIDLHNTTSNMGPTLILLQSDDFNKKLGAYVLQNMPEAVIVYEDQCKTEEQLFVCSISRQGVIVEIGPQPQSVLRHDVLAQMETMTLLILDFVEAYNNESLPDLNNYNAYRYKETLSLPTNEQGERVGMVHSHVQDSDFKALKSGDPLFQLFSGETLYWQGDYEAYPHFINEAAYYDNNLAMSMAEKFTVIL